MELGRCKVRGCELHSAGEMVLWELGKRDPLAAGLCSVHLDAAIEAVLTVIQPSKAAVR